MFILDFFNTVDDIKTAFDPFYTATRLSEATDVNVLHELKDSLDDEGVYEWREVEQFVELYFDNADAQQLSPIIDTAACRFNSELALNDLQKADFKIKAKVRCFDIGINQVSFLQFDRSLQLFGTP